MNVRLLTGSRTLTPVVRFLVRKSVFKRLGGKSDVQFNIKRHWVGFGIWTWPPWTLNGKRVTKRSIDFGIGYISWRVPV